MDLIAQRSVGVTPPNLEGTLSDVNGQFVLDLKKPQDATQRIYLD